ncbi:hypothetical protein BD310DRAFT_600888 [Dichomitus squalens]|uniref:Uncharacterized protein n=1 Tax=Dichomitus squalens TaxID=114155 RepID=A0A4Q9PR03_9APHY|nr:hypothetical protein BD310DRAFT_600888 [Dichomitus squalens]
MPGDDAYLVSDPSEATRVGREVALRADGHPSTTSKRQTQLALRAGPQCQRVSKTEYVRTYWSSASSTGLGTSLCAMTFAACTMRARSAAGPSSYARSISTFQPPATSGTRVRCLCRLRTDEAEYGVLVLGRYLNGSKLPASSVAYPSWSNVREKCAET